MKIALIRKEFDAARGGAERYAVNLARGLAAAGHDVHVFAGSWAEDAGAGITLHRVPFLKRPSPLKNSSFQWSSRRLVAGKHFDIVHGLSQVFPGDVYRQAEPLHAHWLHLHSPSAFSRSLKRLSPRHQTIVSIERRIFAPGSYRRYIAISELCRRQMLHYYGVPEEKIRVIYNGVDLQQFNTDGHDDLCRQFRVRYGIPQDATVLLFAGNDFKRKGLQYALDYAAALKARGYKPMLVVAGRGRREQFARLAAKLQVETNLLFTGKLADLRPAYHGADLLVHPALYEPFGNVCLEAMACGLPVATTRLTGASEIIEDRLSGIIIESPGDILGMSEKIAAALSRHALSEMRALAAAQACAFTLERNLQQTLALYREIRAEKGAAA